MCCTYAGGSTDLTLSMDDVTVELATVQLQQQQQHCATHRRSSAFTSSLYLLR